MGCDRVGAGWLRGLVGYKTAGVAIVARAGVELHETAILGMLEARKGGRWV